jgi:hypothetical protein
VSEAVLAEVRFVQRWGGPERANRPQAVFLPAGAAACRGLSTGAADDRNGGSGAFVPDTCRRLDVGRDRGGPLPPRTWSAEGVQAEENAGCGLRCRLDLLDVPDCHPLVPRP